MPTPNTFNKSCVNYIKSLDFVSFLFLPSIIAFLLSDGLNSEEQEVLGSFINDIGDALTTIASYQELQKAQKRAAEKSNPSKNVERTLLFKTMLEEQEKMKRQVQELQQKFQVIEKYNENNQ